MDGDNHFHHDHLGWEYCSSVQAITTPPILWTSNNNVHHQRHVIDESFLVMSSTKKPSHNNINNNNNNNINTSVVSADIMSSNPSFSCPNSVDDNPFACFAADNSNVATSCSLESLECLLSATNSNTDEDVDDGISLIFSECRNLLNNTNTAKNNVSSGEPSQSPNPNPNPNNNTNSNNNKRSLGLRMVLSESKKPKKNHNQPTTTTTTNINFSTSTASPSSSSEPDPEAVAQMKEMIYRAAAFRPVNMGLETVERPRRKNVRISTDPQTVAARQRRERISERIRVLQRLVPGGTKMDTASMLDEAASYLKFLRSQVKALEGLGHKIDSMNCPSTNFAFSFNPSFPMQTTNNNTTTVLPQVVLQNPNHHHHHHVVSHYQS